MTSRRPSSRTVEACRAAYQAGKGSLTLAQWKRWSLRIKVAAIYRLTHQGRDMPVKDLPPAAAKEWDGKLGN